MPSVGQQRIETKQVRPMLAATLEKGYEHTLRFPGYASPKVDGIRALYSDGVLLSRHLKPIQNRWIGQTLFSEFSKLGLNSNMHFDGELLVYNDEGEFAGFRTCSSMIMAEKPANFNFKFQIFDVFNPQGEAVFSKSGRLHHMNNGTYPDRLFDHWDHIENFNSPYIALLDCQPVYSKEEFLAYHATNISKGYEGTMFRAASGDFYKYGRSTMSEQLLVKYKDFTTSEAIILDLLPLKHNENEVEQNELGYSHRSTKKAGKVTSDHLLGKMRVQDMHTGHEFSIGTGFTDKDREEFMNPKYIGQIAHYKYFAYGGYDKPRHAVFLGFRHPDDMGV
jgi:DNA ligase-1